MPLTSTKPYIIRAFYEWIVDNDLTPHFLVDATVDQVVVPTQHISDGKIVLNAAPTAVRDLELGNDWIFFRTRFNGVSHDVSLPAKAVEAIYAKENGKGIVFPEDDQNDAAIDDTEEQASPPARKKPQLRLIE